MVKHTVLIVLLLAVCAWGDSTVYSGSTFIEDTYISNIPSDATTNMDGRDTLWHYDYTQFLYWRTILIQFKNLDDSLIAGEQTVDSAVIMLYQYLSPFAPDSIYVKGKLCKNVDISDCTHEAWDSPVGDKEWGTDGARNVDGTDCDDCWNESDGSGYDIVGESGRKTRAGSSGYHRFEIPTCHIDSFLAYPDSINAIALWGGYSANQTHKFWSTEKGSNIPKLVIYWSEISEESPVSNARHEPGKTARRHSPEGSSVRHEP